MAADDEADVGEHAADAVEHLLAVAGVALHDRPLGGRQLGGLVEDALGQCVGEPGRVPFPRLRIDAERRNNPKPAVLHFPPAAARVPLFEDLCREGEILLGFSGILRMKRRRLPDRVRHQHHRAQTHRFAQLVVRGEAGHGARARAVAFGPAEISVRLLHATLDDRV